MVPSQLSSQLRLTGTIYLTPRTTVWRSAKARRVRCSCLLGSRPPEAPEDQSRKYKKTFRTPLSQRGAKVFLLLLRGRSVAYSQSTKRSFPVNCPVKFFSSQTLFNSEPFTEISTIHDLRRGGLQSHTILSRSFSGIAFE